MAQSAVVRDYRALETGRRRANRLVLTVAGQEPYRLEGTRTMATPLVCARQRVSQFPLRPYNQGDRRLLILADQLNRVDFVLAGASCVFG